MIPGYDSTRDAEGCWFDNDAADRLVGFFEDCVTHIEGDLAGQPFHLEDWQKGAVACAMCWMRTDQLKRTVRRYREALLYVPRKNGKTPLVAGLALYVLFTDPEIGQQNYIAAGDKEQAGMLFRQARGMVENEPELMSRCEIYGGASSNAASKSIVVSDRSSFLRVISADASGKHGGNTHFAVIDELHVQPNRDLVDVLQTSTASLNRKSPLMVYITTADFDRVSICNEKYNYARRVRDGEIRDPYFLPVIYEAGPDDDWLSEETWAKANPNLDISVSREYLRRESLKAKETPSYENTFKRLHLNVRTQQDVRWIAMHLWDACGAAVDEDSLRGRRAWAAIDFGWRDDYAAMVLVVEDLQDRETVDVICRFWLPRESNRDKRAEPTRTFIDSGLVTLTPGNSTDMESIYAELDRFRSNFDLQSVAIDPANARKQGQDLLNDGYSVAEFVQSKRNYNEPCRKLESMLRDKKIRHGGHPVLRWMASNVQAEINGLNEMMPKKLLSSEKIDGICALTMAIARWMFQTEDTSPTIDIW